MTKLEKAERKVINAAIAGYKHRLKEFDSIDDFLAARSSPKVIALIKACRDLLKEREK